MSGNGKCPDIYECRLGSDSVLKQMVNVRTQAENKFLYARVEQLKRALIMVLSKTLAAADGHDWRTCDEPSCLFARAALTDRV